MTPEENWRLWNAVYYGAPADSAIHNPYLWKLVEIKREGETETQVIDPGKLPPESNVYGLLWRPWPVIHPKFDGP